MPVTDPVVIRSVNEDVRPMCERARNLVVCSSALAAGAPLMLARLEGHRDDERIEDGREEAEGIPAVTVGEAKALAQFLADILPAMENHPYYPLVRKTCIRNVSL